MSFRTVIEKYRSSQFSNRDLGSRFERLMQAFLRTYQLYDGKFKDIWLWEDFPYRYEFGKGQDVGIDIVCKTTEDEYWAVQCKCYSEDEDINKGDVDSFITTSGKRFGNGLKFSHRLWISTTNNWSSNAEESLKNQDPEVQRLNLNDLISAHVDWDKLNEGISGINARLEKFKIREYQKEALDKVHNYFLTHDRGKLIMACGTGKTFLSLKIAEYETKNHGMILVLTPSISLISQTLRTWHEQCDIPIHSICICSDSSVSKKKSSSDNSDVSVIDLALPASTNPDNIREQISQAIQSSKGMIVVFSTYQSIDVISSVQKDVGFEFDLIICDEAHRTTGVTLAGENESSFVKVHNNEFLKSKKRLYMTATPRIYRDVDKKKAKLYDAILCSMDDEHLYGEEMYHLSFGDAVKQGLLSDYKVLVLTVNDNVLTPSIRRLVHSPNSSLTADDATKLVGCYNALSKQIVDDDGILLTDDPDPMRRAVAFCQNISISKEITKEFSSVQEKYIEDLPESRRSKVFAQHIDGTMLSTKRDGLLNWLKNSDKDSIDSECHVLTNVRCLSEGVDVPSLDAVLFLSPRNSKIDIVQSVGRVMRRSPGKKYGYIVIPLVIPSNVDPSKELDRNPGNYKVIWDVLNALRSHDERLAIEIEHIKLDKKKSDRVLIGRPMVESPPNLTQTNLLSHNIFPDLQDAIYARMVQKVGERQYWEHWASKVVDIAAKLEFRIQDLVSDAEVKEIFPKFVACLQKIINPSIDDNQVIEMLSQHLITKPIFEALFGNSSFTDNNLVSRSMQEMIHFLKDNAIEKETQELSKFYKSVRNRVHGITTSEGRQGVLIQLYENFFRIAFPKMVEQLGIVYTPIEIVDFILNSVNDLLKKEFGKSLSDPKVNILDPFTGTGTFIARLLENEDLIKPEDLEKKYSSEIDANEIVLLAYYIASINIENAYHSRIPNSTYISFPGICLTDTFQMKEDRKKQSTIDDYFQNLKKVRDRILNQNSKNIEVIIGNPPYSVGQKAANDNAQNLKYPNLETKIKNTYVVNSKANSKKAVYDSYIKAFRWATDCLNKDGGIIGFITNGGWLDSNSMDRFRKCLERDFSSIYVFNLRGNQRTSGELLKKEGERIFPGIRVSPTITILVKKPNSTNKKAEIYYHDIGDYLSREEKLNKIRSFSSVCNPNMKWERIHPNEAGDWINQRNTIFSTYYPLGDKRSNSPEKAVFLPHYSLGINTSRDSWCYNSSKIKLRNNIQRSIEFYNSQLNAFKIDKIKNSNIKAEDFVDYDSTKFSWSYKAMADINRQIKYSFSEKSVQLALYRPFFKQHVYSGKDIVEAPCRIPQIFPTSDTSNLVICIPGVGESKEFSALITDLIPDRHVVGGGSQCFPLYYYTTEDKNSTKSLSASQTLLFEVNKTENKQVQYTRKDGVSDFILSEAKSKYSNQNITKEDIFYYVYGFLHSREYRELFSADLKKILARIPLVDKKEDFWSFSHSGRKLAGLHLHYENIDSYPDVKVTGEESQNFRVQKMRFIDKDDKSSIQYNSYITIANIPLKAYEYIVNGKSTIEWVMERYSITIDKDTGITNDPNDWSEEHENPRYILDLLLSVINVSMKTIEIVESLPKFEQRC